MPQICGHVVLTWTSVLGARQPVDTRDMKVTSPLGSECEEGECDCVKRL